MSRLSIGLFIAILSPVLIGAVLANGGSAGGGMSIGPAFIEPAGMDLGDLGVLDAMLARTTSGDGQLDGESGDETWWGGVGVEGGLPDTSDAAVFPEWSHALTAASSCAQIQTEINAASADCIASGSCGPPPAAERGRVVTLPAGLFDCGTNSGLDVRPHVTLRGVGRAVGSPTTTITSKNVEVSSPVCFGPTHQKGASGLKGCGTINAFPAYNEARRLVSQSMAAGKTQWIVDDSGGATDDYTLMGSPTGGEDIIVYMRDDEHANLPYEMNANVPGVNDTPFVWGVATNVQADTPVAGQVTITIDDPLPQDWIDSADARIQVISTAQWFGVEDMIVATTLPLSGDNDAPPLSMPPVAITGAKNFWIDNIKIEDVRDTALRMSTVRNGTVIRSKFGKNLCFDSTLWANPLFFNPGPNDGTSKDCGRGGEYTIETNDGAKAILWALNEFEENQTMFRPFHWDHDSVWAYNWSENCALSVGDPVSDNDAFKQHGTWSWRWLFEGNSHCSAWRPDGVHGRNGLTVLYKNRFTAELLYPSRPAAMSSFHIKGNFFRAADDVVAIGNIASAAVNDNAQTGPCGSYFDDPAVCRPFDFIDPGPCTGVHATGTCSDDAHSGYGYEVSYNVLTKPNGMRLVPEALTRCDGVTCTTSGGPTNLSGVLTSGSTWDSVKRPDSLYMQGSKGWRYFHGEDYPTDACACPKGQSGAFDDDFTGGITGLCLLAGELHAREQNNESRCP